MNHTKCTTDKKKYKSEIVKKQYKNIKKLKCEQKMTN